MKSRWRGDFPVVRRAVEPEDLHRMIQVEKMTYQEIADAVGLTVSGVQQAARRYNLLQITNRLSHRWAKPWRVIKERNDSRVFPERLLVEIDSLVNRVPLDEPGGCELGDHFDSAQVVRLLAFGVPLKLRNGQLLAHLSSSASFALGAQRER